MAIVKGTLKVEVASGDWHGDNATSAKAWIVCSENGGGEEKQIFPPPNRTRKETEHRTLFPQWEGHVQTPEKGDEIRIERGAATIHALVVDVEHGDEIGDPTILTLNASAYGRPSEIVYGDCAYYKIAQEQDWDECTIENSSVCPPNTPVMKYIEANRAAREDHGHLYSSGPNLEYRLAVQNHMKEKMQPA